MAKAFALPYLTPVLPRLFLLNNLYQFLSAAHDMAIQIAKAGLTPLYRPNAAEQRVSLQQRLVFGHTDDHNQKDGETIKIKTHLVGYRLANFVSEVCMPMFSP